ncbi:hypothetical protein R5W23_002290 [Gemmata sp. JC673]|uniref:Tetratricopeptide repeat protein n=1 Tax=Gemmata algarum TaxID=2975278 RepID=A0ABU5F0U8_9BACT|nr:hypothetical protein [Gemmata algarum]MDY3561031.1 hypothetical protein [Gemmata algarum]
MRLTRSLFCLVSVVVCLLAAAPPHEDAPDDLIRQANALFREGDKAGADQLYARAEERTGDPGLVAFNRGVVLFDRQKYRDAEQLYACVLDDAACPPDRAARAWYNRGTCLLHRGGSWEVFRAAVACFEHTLDSPAADERLRADARHNIELAKLLCAKERAKEENKKKSPNTDVPPEETHQPRQRPDPQPGGGDPDPNGGEQPTDPGASKGPGGMHAQQQQGTAIKPTETDQTTAGNNAALEVLKDDAQVQQLSEKDARATLAEIEKRNRREQQSLLRTLYGPERTAVRDW